MPILSLTEPERLWSRSEILTRPCPVPAERGIYAWYVCNLPDVPIENCHVKEDHALVYVGIAPACDSSSSNLRKRIRQHLNGNASGSTLRKSLGCLLSNGLGIQLQRVGSRLHFGDGEAKLNEWLKENARVCWAEHPRPWEQEASVIERLDLPLNLGHNSAHPFYRRLGAIRKQARVRATPPGE